MTNKKSEVFVPLVKLSNSSDSDCYFRGFTSIANSAAVQQMTGTEYRWIQISSQ